MIFFQFSLMDIIRKGLSPGLRMFIMFIWVSGLVLMVISMTDFFSRSPFQRGYLLFWALLLYSLYSLIDFAKETRRK